MSIGRPTYNDRSGFRTVDIPVAKRIRQNENVEEAVSWLNHEVGMLLQQEQKVAFKIGVVSEQQQLYNGTKTIVKRITHAWQTDPYSTLLERARQSLSAAGCNVRTGKWQLGRLGMGTAGNILATEFKTPVIGYGPGNEEMAHSPDEYVELKKIYECIYGTAAIVHGLIGIPVCGWTSDEI
jgi:acetylornithine deacetylase/succinyl-diaminopimelate desuccinylase-like protein